MTTARIELHAGDGQAKAEASTPTTSIRPRSYGAPTTVAANQKPTTATNERMVSASACAAIAVAR